MLGRVLYRHWHAVQRDLIALGYRKSDVFTTLSMDEMVSIVLAAPPGSAVYYAVNQGWTTTDHLLATMSEQHDGLVSLPHRLARPGVTDVRPQHPPRIHDHSKPVQNMQFDTMSIQEFEARRAARIKQGA